MGPMMVIFTDEKMVTEGGKKILLKDAQLSTKLSFTPAIEMI